MNKNLLHDETKVPVSINVYKSINDINDGSFIASKQYKRIFDKKDSDIDYVNQVKKILENECLYAGEVRVILTSFNKDLLIGENPSFKDFIDSEYVLWDKYFWISKTVEVGEIE